MGAAETKSAADTTWISRRTGEVKSPRRVEALVCLLPVALTAYQLLEPLYRERANWARSPSAES